MRPSIIGTAAPSTCDLNVQPFAISSFFSLVEFSACESNKKHETKDAQVMKAYRWCRCARAQCGPCGPSEGERSDRPRQDSARDSMPVAPYLVGFATVGSPARVRDTDKVLQHITMRQRPSKNESAHLCVSTARSFAANRWSHCQAKTHG
jgi:hypothetical protein